MVLNTCCSFRFQSSVHTLTSGAYNCSNSRSRDPTPSSGLCGHMAQTASHAHIYKYICSHSHTYIFLKVREKAEWSDQNAPINYSWEKQKNKNPWDLSIREIISHPGSTIKSTMGMKVRLQRLNWNTRWGNDKAMFKARWVTHVGCSAGTKVWEQPGLQRKTPS